MLILAIDSSCSSGCCALVEDGSVLAERTTPGDRTHSETLMPLIKGLFDDTGRDLASVDMIAVCVGPGSFTGIRIGVAVAKGLAFGRNIPCVGISSLDALAFSSGIEGTVIPMIDARRGSAYSAVYTGYEKTVPDRQLDYESIIRESGNYTDPVFVGDGILNPIFDSHPELYRSKGVIYANGIGIAGAALKVYMNEKDKSVFDDIHLKPVYLKPSQAERERLEKEKND